MYVCVCHGITESSVRAAAQAGVRSLAELAAQTGCGTCCGSCIELAEEILADARARPLPLPVFAAAA